MRPVLNSYCYFIKTCKIYIHNVAIGSFNDAALEPVVRKCDKELREALKRDGLRCDESESVTFAQYDAIYSMGDRRGECWIELNEEGCPW